jgi:hypothetical protein
VPLRPCNLLLRRGISPVETAIRGPWQSGKPDRRVGSWWERYESGDGPDNPHWQRNQRPNQRQSALHGYTHHAKRQKA